MIVFTLLSALFPAPAAYAADGDLDGTFGTGGKVTTDIGSAADSGNAVAIQTDGRIWRERAMTILPTTLCWYATKAGLTTWVGW